MPRQVLLADPVIIIDWDDTVICTSYLECKKKIRPNAIDEFDKRTKDCLAKLDHSAVGSAHAERAVREGAPVRDAGDPHERLRTLGGPVR